MLAPLTQEIHPENSSLRQDVESTTKSAQPGPEQRYFDVAPSNILNKQRRIAVTILIVLANLMQVR